MKRTWLLMLLLAMPAPALAGVPAMDLPGDLTLLHQDQWGFTVELEVPPYRMETTEGPEGACQRLMVDGWARTAAAGLPELPLLGCTIPLPGNVGLRAEILETEFKYLKVPRLFPVPLPTVPPDQHLGRSGREAAETRCLSGRYPENLVRVEAPAVQRGQRLARVLFQPFQWDPADGRLRCATRLRVRLLFDSSGVSLAAGEPDRLPDLPGGMPGVFLRGALRIEVEEDGLHAMDYRQALAASGIDRQLIKNLDPATLKLFNRGVEIPIIVSNPDQEAPWPGGNLFFYGQGFESHFTDANVYWLYWDGPPGARIETRNGNLFGSGSLVPWASETVRAEENHRLWENSPGAPDLDYWFWDLLTAPVTKTCSLDIAHPSPGQWDATLRVGFQGRSTSSPHPNHHTRILFNGVEVGDVFWDGARQYVQEITVPSNLLAHGANVVSVECPGDTGAVVDSVYLNWIELDYQRRLIGVDDQMVAAVQGNGPYNFAIGGFSSPTVAVFDISDPGAVTHVVDVGISGEGPYTVLFGDKLNGSERYLAVSPDRFLQPSAVEAWTSPGLRGGWNGADYILITPRDFLAAAEPLILYRQGQGLRSVAVAVEDIYNDFNFGLPDPAALKSFLTCAYQYWTPPAPLFVLLLGDANTDYLDYFDTGKQSLVPVHLSITELGLTPDDNWYVAVEGDDVLPEMCIGRLPSSDEEMAARLVERLLAHESALSPAPSHALFSADDETTFETLNETLIALLPGNIPPDRVYLSDYTVTAEATEDIRRGVNRGEMLVHYNGHGSVTAWAGEYLFDSDDVAGLTNEDALAFVLTMTCLNGYFSHPFYSSIAEGFASAQTGGGFGCLSPSGLSYTWEQNLLAPKIFSQIFDEGEDRIGVIITQAKLEAHALGAGDAMVRMFTLLGDPASRLKPWE